MIGPVPSIPGYGRISVQGAPARFAGRHYMQNASGGTWRHPVVNNCTKASVCNLLAFFNRDRDLDVIAALEDMLDALHERREDLYRYIVPNPQRLPDDPELQMTLPGIAEFLELLGTRPELVEACTRSSRDAALAAIAHGKPLLIFDDRTETLANGYTPAGHCYLVYPGPNGECLVADSNLPAPVRIPLGRLKAKLLRDENSRALIVNRAPDVDGYYRRLRRLRVLV